MATIWQCAKTGKTFKSKIDLDTYHKIIGRPAPIDVPPPVGPKAQAALSNPKIPYEVAIKVKHDEEE